MQDLLLWGTSEFGYVRFGDGFVQSSSIMPQKRNPVAIEHARAIGSKAFGQAQAILTSVHNTPFGDIVDTEDDLQPLVVSMFRDATRMVTLVAAAIPTRRVRRRAARPPRGRRLDDADRAGRHAGAGARAAVRHGARHLRASGRGAPGAIRSGRCRRSSPTRRASCSARRSSTSEDALQRILSPRHFVEVRRTLGGPAPEETGRAVAFVVGARRRPAMGGADDRGARRGGAPPRGPQRAPVAVTGSGTQDTKDAEAVTQ